MNYIQEAIRTESLDLFKVERPRLLHAVLGVITETMELIQNTDHINEIEEVGDIYWYLAIGADELKTSFEDLKLLSQYQVQQLRDMDEEDAGITVALTVHELADVLKRASFYGVSLDEVRLARAFGNILMILAAIEEAGEFTAAEAQERNIAKLRKRYPDRFTTEAAVNRDLAAEHEALADG